MTVDNVCRLACIAYLSKQEGVKQRDIRDFFNLSTGSNVTIMIKLPLFCLKESVSLEDFESGKSWKAYCSGSFNTKNASFSFQKYVFSFFGLFAANLIFFCGMQIEKGELARKGRSEKKILSSVCHTF